MSFFDEDDEPPRTARTRVRPSPPPRRGRVTSGGSIGRPDRARAPDDRRHRRRSWSSCCCSSSSARATTRATRTRCATTTARSRQIGTESQQTGETSSSRRWTAPARPRRPSSTRTILGIKGSADQSLKQAAGPERPRRHGPRAAVAADRARAAPRRAAGDLRRHQERARRRGRQRRRRRSTDRRPDARASTPPTCSTTRASSRSSRPALHGRGPGRRRSRRRSSCKRDLVGLAGVRGAEARHAASPTGSDGGNGDGTTKNQPTGPGLHGTGLNSHHLRQRHAVARARPTG